MSNLRNTVSCLNRFVGRSADEADIEIERKFWTCKQGQKDGEVAAIVNYRGEEHTFGATEIMAMFLGKLKGIAQNESKVAVSDCVISVPVHFTDAQRRAMLDAAAISGLNCLRLINDTTATSLCYGLTKNDQFTEKPKNVCFVDIGYASMKVTVASFTKGNLEIKGTAWDRHLGGRDFDEALVDHFAQNIQATYKEDLKSSPRGILRLRTACEKIKKVLSGISSTKVELETESRDFPLHMTRELFEQLIAPLLTKVDACLAKALVAAGLGVAEIDSVEIVGGSTRVPSIKQSITNFFGKETSTTLNQDEAIARGCAFQCAIESPSFKVREFGIKDVISFPYKVTWAAAEGPKEVEVFPEHSNLPSIKPLFIGDKLPLTLNAFYTEKAEVPAGTKAQVASFEVTNSKVLPEAKVRVDIGINGHGLIYVKKALLVEEKLEEVAGETPDAPKQIKKIIREHEVAVKSSSASLDSKELQKRKDSEFALCLSDKYAQELDDSRNSLEEYIYEVRAKLDDVLKPFVQEADAAVLKQMLSDAEQWLYDEHESENKEMYLGKLAELKKLGNPIYIRAKEHENRPLAENLFRQLIETILVKANDLVIEEAELAKLHQECAAKLAWLQTETAQQAALPLHADPKLTVARINDQREKLLTVSSAIFAKATPKKADSPAPTENSTEAGTSGEKSASGESMEVD